jgi:hypothetical protein
MPKRFCQNVSPTVPQECHSRQYLAFLHRGHRVTGVDPSPQMLAVARSRAGGELVRWIQGDATCLAAGESEIRYRFPAGEELVSHGQLRFRSYAWLSRALVDAGFRVDPVDHDAPDLIFMARAEPARQPVEADDRRQDE